MKKSKLLFLGFLPVLATPIIALSCANPEKPEKPAEPKKPENPEPKKPETPSKDKNQQFGDNIKIVYEDLKKHHSKEVLADLIKQNKPIKDLLIKNAIKLDSVDSINTNNNLINNIKNEAPKIEIDFSDPTNEEIKNVIDNFYYKNLYKEYDRTKDDGKHGFDFLDDGYTDLGVISMQNNEPDYNEPWDEDDEPGELSFTNAENMNIKTKSEESFVKKTYDPKKDDGKNQNFDFSIDDNNKDLIVSKSEGRPWQELPDHNVPWISDDEEGKDNSKQDSKPQMMSPELKKTEGEKQPMVFTDFADLANSFLKGIEGKGPIFIFEPRSTKN
ncbi:hypothetical protein [Mycoplasma sp. 3398]